MFKLNKEENIIINRVLKVVPIYIATRWYLLPLQILLSIRYNSLDEFIRNMQLHASNILKDMRYVVFVPKKSPPIGLLETYYLCCDRGRKSFWTKTKSRWLTNK